MRIRTLFLLIALSFFVTLAAGQRSITITTDRSNISGIRAAIDHPELNGNADAIIVASAPGYTHPIAVWFLADKWYVFNTDQASIMPGQTFNIQFWAHSDANHFVHVATPQNLQAGRSYIENPSLEHNPTAAITVFQSMSNARGGYWNANEARALYDPHAEKWYVVNKNAQPILPGNAYNVVVSQAQSGVTAPVAFQGTQVAGGPLEPEYAPEPLRFRPQLGKKIILYPGQTGDVGFSVAGNLLQIHSDNSNADVAIGYEQGGTFRERFRVKANGALEVNGSPGKPGEVLMSIGPGGPPVWTPMSTPVYAFANCQPDGPNVFLGIKCTASALPNQSAAIEALRTTLSLKKASIVVMNGRFRMMSEGGAVFVTANGVRVSPFMRYAGADVRNFLITNLMFRLEPGNYTLDCGFLYLGGDRPDQGPDTYKNPSGMAAEYVSYAAYPIE